MKDEDKKKKPTTHITISTYYRNMENATGDEVKLGQNYKFRIFRHVMTLRRGKSKIDEKVYQRSLSLDSSIIFNYFNNRITRPIPKTSR